MYGPHSYVVEFLLVLSNVAFFIPAIRAVNKRRWTRAAVYLLIVFASSGYHTCRSYHDFCLFSFSTHHKLDYFFAELTIPLSALYFIDFPLKYQWTERWLIILYALLIFVAQVFTSGELVVQLIIVGSSTLMLFLYWLFWGVPKYNWIMLERGVLATAGSTTLFSTQSSFMAGYWAMHSIWHVLGALGQDYILRVKPAAPAYASLDAPLKWPLKSIRIKLSGLE